MRMDNGDGHGLPQREPLIFNINVEGGPSEISELVSSIKAVAEQVLFHWQSFPIHIPPPVAVTYDPEYQTAKKPLSIRDLFEAPSFDELDAVAVDAKGEPRRLTDKQLQSIRENGEFEVESLNFPGQFHRWRLSQLLLKGTHCAHHDLLKDTALALRFILVTIPSRIRSPFLSFSEALAGWLRGLSLLTDAFIGVPSLCVGDLDFKLRDERCKYLVAELVVRPNLEEDLDNLCLFIRQQIQRQNVEKATLEPEQPLPVPCLYQTPKGIYIDLRLYNRDLMRRALPILASVLEHEARGWFLQFREQTIAELRGKKLPDEEIEKQANLAIMNEYLHRVYNTILNSPQMSELGPGIGQLFVDHAQSVILMHRAVENVQAALNKSQAELQRRMQDSYSVLSKINPWLQEQLAQAELRLSEDLKWRAHEDALAACRENKLKQSAYFLHRDLTFLREREPVLKKELSRVQSPTRSYTWRMQIWSPKHWVVRKVYRGESEVVPTVISKSSTGCSSMARNDPSQPVYLVDKESSYATTTRWPFWRWNNYCHRTCTWVWNAMFIFGVVIPWCSPCSFRALFSIEPFMPDLEPQANGVLVPRKSSVTRTLCSRLLSLWRHISKSRTEFETRPDTGFIGKGFSRHINRVWNYCIKGIFGTLMLTLGFPIVCLLVSLISLLIAVLAPLWMPVGVLMFHLVCILVYDFDSPDASHNKWFVLLEAIFLHICMRGCIQPVIALVIISVICPVACLAILIFAVARRGGRLLWDTVVFHSIIKKRGRIPASDGLFARRTAGPGLSPNYYYQITSEQAVAAFEVRLEFDELSAYREQTDRLIQQPLHIYSEFVEATFRPFSAVLTKEGMYLKLETEVSELRATLKEKVDRRKRELQSGLSISVRSKIKLPAHELKLVIKQCTILLEQFYPARVLQRLVIPEEDFWANKGLRVRDWAGLAALMLTEIFSPDFLTPLEETDLCFKLKARHVNLSRYTEMLHIAALRTDLDVVSSVHVPKGNIQVHSPYLDVTTFNPSWKRGTATARKTLDKCSHMASWRRPSSSLSPAELLHIPLLVPHPALVACVIYARDHGDIDGVTVAVDTPTAHAVLRAIEDAPNPLGTSFITVDLTPPDSQSLASHTTVEEDSFRLSRATNAVSDFHSDSRLERRRYKHHRTRLTDRHAEKSFPAEESEETETSSPVSHHGSGTIGINLASSEDITLEPEGDRVTYNHSYGTTV